MKNKNVDFKKIFTKNNIIIGIIIIIILVALIFIIKAIIKPSTKYNDIGVDTPLVYINSDNQLKYLTYANQTPKTLLGGVSLENDYLYLYDLKEDNKFSFTTLDSLYLVDTNNLDNVMKLVNGYTSYKRNKKYFVYTVDNTLYILNIVTNEKSKIDSNVTNITYITDKYYVYLKDGYEYLKSFKNSDLKIKLGKFDEYQYNVDTNIIKLSDEYDKVLFRDDIEDEQYDKLVLYDIKNEERKEITNDCYDVKYISDDLTKIGYSSVSKKELAIYYAIKYKTDVYKLIEKVFGGKETINYYDTTCSNSNKHCLEMIEDGNVYKTIELSDDEYNTFILRDKLYSDNSEYYIYLFNLYFYEDEKSELLAGDVENGASIFENKDVAYSRFNYKKVDVDKISLSNYCNKNCLTVSDAVQSLKYNIYYKKYNKAESLVEEDSNLSSGISSLSKYRILSIYNENSSNREYYRINFEDDKAIKGEKIIENGLPYYDDINFYDDGFLYFENHNYEKQKGDLYAYINGKKIHIADDVYLESVMYKNDILYFVEGYDFDLDFGTFSKYNLKNNNKEKIVSDVKNALFVDDNKYFIIKDYSPSNKTFDLYSYNNGNLKAIEYSVKVTNRFNFIP